jgi:hypothetical protein
VPSTKLALSRIQIGFQREVRNSHLKTFFTTILEINLQQNISRFPKNKSNITYLKNLFTTKLEINLQQEFPPFPTKRK